MLLSRWSQVQGKSVGLTAKSWEVALPEKSVLKPTGPRTPLISA
jgi:hypothetical protein